MLVVIIFLFCAAFVFLTVQLINRSADELYSDSENDLTENVTEDLKIESGLISVNTDNIVEPPKKKRGRKPKAV